MLPVLAATDVAQHIAFGVIAAIVIFGALRVVTADNVVHAALYLVAVLAGVGASFLLLGAEFVGVSQILVYVGAIVVLFLFGIMLTRAPIGREQHLTGSGWAVGLVVGIALAGVLGYALIDAFGSDKVGDLEPQTTAAVADSIFSTYLIPFEVVSVLLLAALVGAIVLARKE
jgi:NADH-quinone oxidoreductase subunit J